MPKPSGKKNIYYPWMRGGLREKKRRIKKNLNKKNVSGGRAGGLGNQGDPVRV